MTEQYHEFVGAGAEVLAVVKASREEAASFFSKRPVPFPCLVDPERRVYDLYGVESKAVSLGQRPGLFVVDRQGVVRYGHIGWQQWDIPSNAEVLGVCRSVGGEAGGG